MRIRTNSKYYTEIKNLSFAPETDITNNSLPINEFSVDIITDDDIHVGAGAKLCDDISSDPWLYGRIVYAERLQADTITVRVQSWFRVLDTRTLSAVMYNNEPVANVLSQIFRSTDYTLDTSFANATISGYAPKQTARERLQWICLYIGAYVRSYDSSDILIVPLLDESQAIIPAEKTFWRPSLTYEDYVETLTVTAYSYTQGTPGSGDKSIDVGGVTYIVTEQEHSLINPNIPSGITGQVVTISNVYLVNESNVSDILTNLSMIYFNRVKADVDVINNREYFPGDLITFCLDEDRMATGYIESCSFSFGLQARSRLRINGIEDLETAVLIIKYQYNNRTIAKQRYRLPVGYDYEIDNIYPDIIQPGHRYIYRPLNVKATGTIVSGQNVSIQPCEIALHYYYDNSVLEIISVDEVSQTEGTVKVD